MLSKCYIFLLPSFPVRAQVLSSLVVAWGSNSPDLDCYVEKHSDASLGFHGRECCDKLVMSALDRGLESILCVPSVCYFWFILTFSSQMGEMRPERPRIHHLNWEKNKHLLSFDPGLFLPSRPPFFTAWVGRVKGSVIGEHPRTGSQTPPFPHSLL